MKSILSFCEWNRTTSNIQQAEVCVCVPPNQKKLGCMYATHKLAKHKNVTPMARMLKSSRKLLDMARSVQCLDYMWINRYHSHCFVPRAHHNAKSERCFHAHMNGMLHSLHVLFCACHPCFHGSSCHTWALVDMFALLLKKWFFWFRFNLLQAKLIPSDIAWRTLHHRLKKNIHASLHANLPHTLGMLQHGRYVLGFLHVCI